MTTRAIVSAFVGLALGACAQQSGVDASNDWVHPQQAPGRGCEAQGAPENAQVAFPSDPTAQRLLGRWTDGFWMGTDGTQSGDCVTVAVLGIDEQDGSAKVHFGFSGRSDPWITDAAYKDGIISHKTRGGLAFWIKVDNEGSLRIKFLDNDPVATYFATLRHDE